MRLQRVTFSGRLADYDGEKPEAMGMVVLKGIAAVAVDVSVALCVAAFSFSVFMSKLVAPYERGFYCSEVEGLSYPYRRGTVSTRHLLSVSLALPLFIIFFVEAIFFSSSIGSNRLRKCFSSTTYAFLKYLASYTLATFIMEATKCMFARLRPHYLSVCQPNWNLVNCTDPNTFIENAHCMGDEHRIRIGRQSFPSGHSAAAALFFTFLYFYLTSLVRASKLKSLRIVRVVLLLCVGVWASVVLVTRVTDNWHHPTDVLGGICLGVSCVYLVFGWKENASDVYERRHVARPHDA